MKEKEPVQEIIIPSQSQSHKTCTIIPNTETKKYGTKKQSYASVAASKLIQVLEYPWTQVKYKNRKSSTQ